MSRKGKKDWDLWMLLSVVGFVFELMRVSVNALQKRGGTIEHLRRLLKEPALVDQVFDLLVPAGSVTEVPLGENEYLVPVTYAPLPPFSELEQEFGKGNVSNIFDGRPFQKHSSCENIDETPGDKVFLLKHFGRETRSEDNIAEMDKLGYRPATHIEAYAFQKKHPELQRKFWIVALGSFAMFGGDRCVAVLNGGSGRRVFGDRWFGRGWCSSGRFLFVRK